MLLNLVWDRVREFRTPERTLGEASRATACVRPSANSAEAESDVSARRKNCLAGFETMLAAYVDLLIGDLRGE